MMYSQRFKDRARSLFNSQVVRSKERKDKNGRITKRGYLLPFDFAAFFHWFLQALGGSEGAIVRCPYCTAVMDAYTLVVDHSDPLRRGGSPGLENLSLVCASCNDIKGQLTASEFRLFLDKLREIELAFGAAPVRNITSRLESQTRLATKARWDAAKQFKKHTTAAVAEEDF